jgi:hypothetical protein
VTFQVEILSPVWSTGGGDVKTKSTYLLATSINNLSRFSYSVGMLRHERAVAKEAVSGQMRRALGMTEMDLALGALLKELEFGRRPQASKIVSFRRLRSASLGALLIKTKGVERFMLGGLLP